MKNISPACAVIGVLIFMAAIPSAPVEAQQYVRSPVVHDDRTVTFRYFAPEAKHVSLQGNVPEISGELKKDESGVWSITVGPLAPDTYPYVFTVDKARVLDPVNRQMKAWMWMNNTVEIPADVSAGETPAIHQLQNVPHGTVHIDRYQSETLDQSRQLFIYTPPGYTGGDQAYPVLYLLHGFGDDESAWVRVGQLHFIADNVLAHGDSVPAIIVMPLGHVSLPQEPNYQDYRAMENIRAMEKELIEGVLPFVENNYRCKTGSANRAIAGLSMGGGQTLQFGINNLDKFGWIAGLSPSITKQKIGETTKTNLSKLLNEKPWLWIGCGKDDFLFQESTEFDKWLTDNGVPHTFRITEGAHNWRCWRRYLGEVLGEVFSE